MADHGTVRRAARAAKTAAGAVLLLPLLLAAAAPPWNGAAGYPTPATTGVPAGTTLTDYTGPCTITTAGAVIDAKRVLCEDLDVNAPGVVIRNSEVHGEIRHSVAGEPLQVVDSTLGPPTGCDPGSAISEAHYTATRLEVRNVGDGFRYSGDNITVQDSYVKICDEAGENEEWHADGMQGYFGGENAVFHHNTVDMPEEGGVTSPVFWADYSAGGLRLTDNLLMGGGYVIRVYHYGGARHVVSGNRVANDRWGFGPVDSHCGQIDWSDNTLVTIDAGYNVTSTVGAFDCTGD